MRGRTVGNLRPIEDDSDGVPELIGQGHPVDRQDQGARPTPEAKAESDAMDLLLRALRQTLVAGSTLFTLVVAASAFWLWWGVLPAPTPLQLIGLGMYSAFVLALEFVRRR